MLTEAPELSDYQIVKGYWAGRHAGQTKAADFETWWRRSVHDGVVPDTALPAKPVSVHADAIREPAPKRRLAGKLEVLFRPDPAIYDGRFANNGWLQEMPKPITKLTWDNAAIMSPQTASRLGVYYQGLSDPSQQVPMVELTYQGRSLRAPVFIQPGHADA
jgi:molybdopterin-containing oxidoreductase family iron-sulfur binding subunit